MSESIYLSEIARNFEGAGGVVRAANASASGYLARIAAASSDINDQKLLKQLPQLIRPRKVMATPPTVVFGTVTAGGTLTKTYWAGTSGTSWLLASAPSRSHFTYSRGLVGYNGDGTIGSGTNGVGMNTVTATSATTKSGGMFQASFLHYGEMLEIVVAQTGTFLMVRVDDEYVSLTPETLGSSGTNYMKLAFGARSYRRIDVIGASSFSFRGVNVEPGDLVTPAPTRGPRVICLGDSFTQPGVQGWPAFLSDALSWDDVWAAGVGGTGWVTDGGKKVFGDRIASDVIAYAPDIALLHGSVNDGGSNAAAASAAIGTAVAAIRAALPNCLVIGGMNAVGGVETFAAGFLDTLDGMKSAVEAAGGVWLNPVEMPLEYTGGTLPSTTVVGTHAALRVGAAPNAAPYNVGDTNTGIKGAATVSVGVNLRVGSTIEIGTGAVRERVVITGLTQLNGTTLSYSFQGALQYGHVAGEPIREVGASYMTGTGQVGATTSWGNADTLVSSDAVHPSVEGHQVIGLVQAQLLSDYLRRLI